MNLCERGMNRAESMRFDKVLRKNIFDEGCVRFDDSAHDPSNLRLIESFSERIDRQNSARRSLLVIGQVLDPRMLHLPAHAFQARLAGDQHPPAFDQLLSHPRLIEPKATEVL